MDTQRPIEPGELHQRLLHAFGRSVALLADAFGTTLRDAQETIRMAYFHEMKSRGLKLKEIAAQLDVSERHVKRLQSGFRETFLSDEREYDLPVRIEFLLWATPVSRQKVKQLLRRFEADERAIDEAIDDLIAMERVVEEGGELAVRRAVHSKLNHTWLARIGGLTSFVLNLSDAAYARFIDDEPHAFARTLSFLIRPDDIQVLERHFRDTLVPLVQQLDEEAKASEDGEPIRLSLCWAPYDYIKRRTDTDDPSDEKGV